MKKIGLFGFKNIIVFLVSFALLINVGIILKAIADSVSTSVTVGNSAPTFTAGPSESTESSSTNPTNVGTAVTWQATATDSNSENYYLIVCSSNSVNPTNGGAPTCGGTQWCVSSATTSGSQATCSRTALAGDSETNAWYAFVCDGNSSAANCSSSSQGTGATGSPFEVNHAPSFTNISSDTPRNPGQTITWSATASDADTGSSDTVKLVVCKTAGLSGDACDGGGSDTWCTSSAVTSNPSCGYSIPSVAPDGTFDAYVYVVDNHNFGSSSGNQGSNSSYVINNISPVVSAVTINGGNAINLTEGTTTNVVLTATITDNNSCYGGEISSVLAYAYRSSITYANCNDSTDNDNNYCYADISCTVVGGSCTDDTDGSADYTCTVALQYYADPTDVNTQYSSDTWKDTIKVIDDDAAEASTEVTTGVALNSLTALDVTNSVNYGALDVNQSNDPLDKITTVTPTGNVGLDVELSGVQMCTDYPTCSGGTIAVGYQKYALASSTSYASGIALTGSPVEAELNVPKATSGSPTTKNLWWGIFIPSGTSPGSYSGGNTVGAVKGEVVNW